MTSSEQPFHLWLKQRRIELDLSRVELADLIGCSLATIRQIEQGRRRPSRQMAERMARYLQIPADERPAFVRLARAQEPVATQPPAISQPDVDRPAWRGELPSPIHPLIGREAELAAARALIALPEARLLTLVGPGGVGKTRLGLQLAHEIQPDFADRAYFIDLAVLNDHRLIPQAIAQTLQLLDVLAAPSVERLIDVLRDRELLLLVDNIEHLLEGAPQIAALVKGCPQLKVIATSRSALRLQAERCYIVPPLALPDHTALPREGTAATALAYPAVQLFVSRARMVQPNFALTDENADAVAQICHRLDGLPLAIELAAARVRGLPPRAMLSRLSNRLDILAGGMRDLPERQQTIRDLIDWSYDLLDPQEQLVFRRLGVFVGSWALSSAETVCAWRAEPAEMHAGFPSTSFPILPSLVSLLDKSLLIERHLGDGEAGFAMLETIRAYALERLETSGEIELLRQRHADCYLALVEEAEPELTRSQQRLWLDRLEWEHDNIRAALSWLIKSRAGGQALRLVGAIWRFWQFRDHHSEGLRWAEEALALPNQERPETKARVKVLCGAGWLAVDQADYRRAEDHFNAARDQARQADDQHGLGLALHGVSMLARDSTLSLSAAQESLAIFRSLGDDEQIAWSLRQVGGTLQFQGDDPAAVALYAESLALLRSLGHHWGVIRLMLPLAHVWIEQGEYDRAATLLDETLALCRDQGYHRLMIETLRYLGRAALDQGSYAQAADYFEESLGLAHALEESNGVRWALAHLGQTALAQGQAAQAHALLNQALGMTRASQEQWTRAWITAQLGQAAQQQGDVALARRYYLDSLRFYQSNHLLWGIPDCLEGLANIFAARPDANVERSAWLLGAAESLRQRINHIRPPSKQPSYDQTYTTVRERLGEEHFSAAWQAGQALSPEQAVALALEEA
ncbi:MAG: tetratricopeptide repeat protein [Chloroflexi bacterium]|nr:tetratricopeptide repeat protein [Chloroflexota bacterium]